MILLMIFIGIMLALFYGDLLINKDYPTYSSHSREDKGTKVLYYLANELQYNVSRFTKSAYKLRGYANKTLVIFQPDMKILNEYEISELKRFVTAGNSIFVIAEDDQINNFWVSNFAKDSKKGLDNVYLIGKGKLIVLYGPQIYTNEQLVVEEPALIFIRSLEIADNRDVLFDEYYLGLGSPPGFMDALGPTGRILWVQLLLGVGVWMTAGIRRFGKNKIVAENSKRTENENLRALASLLEKTKAYGIIFGLYKERFYKILLQYFRLPKTKANYELLPTLTIEDQQMNKLKVPDFLNKLLELENRGKISHNVLRMMIKKMEEIRKVTT